jgi:hypothetical protein
MFTPAQLLDPLRVVHGARNDHYDCPDVATLDRHINHLRCRIASVGDQAHNVADDYRADIDRLLDRRFWLTLPMASNELEQSNHRTA